VDEKPELLYKDLTLGKEFPLFIYPITEELVNQFCRVVGDRNPLYFDDGLAQKAGLGGKIAPPGLAAVYARLSYLQDHTMPSGGVLAKQEFEFHGPARIGDTLQVEARVEESYLDEKERKRVTFLIAAENQWGEPISTIRLYAIWPK
jgi:acyl dehydratase